MSDVTQGGGGPEFAIEPIDIQEEMERSFLDYAMSVSYTHLTLPTTPYV